MAIEFTRNELSTLYRVLDTYILDDQMAIEFTRNELSTLYRVLDTYILEGSRQSCDMKAAEAIRYKIQHEICSGVVNNFFAVSPP